MGSLNGGPGVGLGVEREESSHVERREERGWERKKTDWQPLCHL